MVSTGMTMLLFLNHKEESCVYPQRNTILDVDGLFYLTEEKYFKLEFQIYEFHFKT